MSKVEHLNWDSNFFGFGVAKIEGDDFDEAEFIYIINQLWSQNVKLIYLITNNIKIAKLYDGIHVDDKTTYCMNLTHKPELDIKEIVLEEYSGGNDLELYDLAIQAGEFSRFMIDTNMPAGLGDKLYHEWMRKSINKNIADAVLVAKHNNNIVGMVTVGNKNGKGDIGLIAVDSSMRGRSVGKSLVRYAQRWFHDNGQFNLQVVTQGANKAACGLYDNCGYSIEKIEPYYHIWLPE